MYSHTNKSVKGYFYRKIKGIDTVLLSADICEIDFVIDPDDLEMISSLSDVVDNYNSSLLPVLEKHALFLKKVC